ncbi:MAG: hypothetical protein ACR2O3_05360 [Rhizobiaceae bacterium]
MQQSVPDSDIDPDGEKSALLTLIIPVEFGLLDSFPEFLSTAA